MKFLFGKQVRNMPPSGNGKRLLFILGAYPSALHVRWHHPGLVTSIRAVAIDNEPEPFWTGKGEQELIEEWKRAVGFQDKWGSVFPCGGSNGPSGLWVEKKILVPLGLPRSKAWITDCLDTYFESKAAADRLNAPELVNLIKQYGIPDRQHRHHPSESDIVSEAKQHHLERLRNELTIASPELIVTLGNAALRVMNILIDGYSDKISKLSAKEEYGRKFQVQVCGQNAEWLPLAHPAAPKIYQDAHDIWCKSFNTRVQEVDRNIGKEG